MDTIELAKIIRTHALKMTSSGGSSHIGSILSIADILAVLYEKILKYDPDNTRWEERDRLILSKGHAGAGIYAVLAEKGFFPVDKLNTHCQDGSDLSGHVSHKGIPGVELSTGSLGHGLSVGAGRALAAKLGEKKYRTIVIMSDGECDEGSNWEAIMFSAHHKLGNLIAIVDYNKLQSIKSTTETLNLEPFADKWRSFGWDVKEVDGHNHEELIKVLSELNHGRDKPACVIANTIKGKGVPFMENNVLWHYKSPQDDELKNALSALEG